MALDACSARYQMHISQSDVCVLSNLVLDACISRHQMQVMSGLSLAIHNSLVVKSHTIFSLLSLQQKSDLSLVLMFFIYIISKLLAFDHLQHAYLRVHVSVVQQG